MLTWAAGVDIFCFLDSQGYPERIGPGLECLLAVGAGDSLEAPAGQAFPRLKEWALNRGEWLFGHFAYDLAAETEAASPQPPQKTDPVGFPDLFFFIPENLIELSAHDIRIGTFQGDQEAIWRQIQATPLPASASDPALQRPPLASIPSFIPRFTPDEYRERVADLQRHILRGDCYEINFCQEFYSQPASLDPLPPGGPWAAPRQTRSPASTG